LNNDDNNNYINTNQKLSLRSEKSKIYTFTMNIIKIVMTIRTMASVKYDKETTETINISIYI
jgi:hypothetical protein